MSDQFLNSMVTVAMGIIGVAILAVLVSKNSQTGQVLTSAGQSFSTSLSAALSPIVGGNTFTGSSPVGYSYPV